MTTAIENDKLRDAIECINTWGGTRDLPESIESDRLRRTATARVNDARDYLRGLWCKPRGLRRSQSLSFLRRFIGKHRSLPGDDHCEGFNYKGKPYLWLSQPYPERWERALAEGRVDLACRDHGLVYTVSREPSWHFPIGVLTVCWTKVGTTDNPIEDERKAAAR